MSCERQTVRGSISGTCVCVCVCGAPVCDFRCICRWSFGRTAMFMTVDNSRRLRCLSLHYHTAHGRPPTCCCQSLFSIFSCSRHRGHAPSPESRLAAPQVGLTFHTPQNAGGGDGAADYTPAAFLARLSNKKLSYCWQTEHIYDEADVLPCRNRSFYVRGVSTCSGYH